MISNFKRLLQKKIYLFVLTTCVILFSSWTIYNVFFSKSDLLAIVKASSEASVSVRKLIEKNLTKKTEQETNIIQRDNSERIIDDYVNSPEKNLSRNMPSLNNLLNLDYANGLISSGFIGVIGNANGIDENAADNVFSAEIKNLDVNKIYLLEYDLDGYSGIGAVTRSINGNISLGGAYKQGHKGWLHVAEKISPKILENGKNILLFNALKKNDVYSIKNVTVRETKEEVKRGINITETFLTDKALYIRGFIDGESFPQELSVDGNKTKMLSSEFEVFLKDKKLSESVSFLYNNISASLKIPVADSNIKDDAILSELPSFYNNVLIESETEKLLGLRAYDFPPQNASFVNIGKDYEGFKYQNLKRSVQEFSLPIDLAKLPKGYTENDIEVLKFDFDKKLWINAPLDSVNVKEQKVFLSMDFGKTDYVVGVSNKVESPDGGGNAAVGFDNSPIANPASKINLIAPPTPNQQGSAVVTYPIEIPAGVHGFQPEVKLVYDSDNKFGWAGTGWNIPIETIDIDTRWGVPKFAADESEVYLIAGEQLVFNDNYLPHKVPYTEPRVANRLFYYRNGIKDGYSITRKGSGTGSYTWETIDGQGTKKEYNDVLTNIPGSNSSGNIVKWYLSKVTDRFGNIIIYTYSDSFEGGGKNKYLSRITYSNNTVIEFTNEPGTRPDLTFNYRLGVKLVDAKILSSIQVKRANIAIRNYILVNTLFGAFQKRLLTEILQYDGNGVFFNKHVLKYDLNTEIFSQNPTQVYSTPNDNSDVGSFSGGNTTIINGLYSKNKNVKGSISLGFGPCLPPISINKRNTLGATISYDDNRAYGKSQLVDIDGDGILDKTFYTNSGAIRYRKNNKMGFGGVSGTTGLPGGTPLSKHNSYNTTLGLEFSFSGGVIGFNYSDANTNAPTYLSDVNGDGLVDMVNYGEVFFNKIRNGTPEFISQNYAGNQNVTETTPNAILAGSGVVYDTITTTQSAKSLANIVRMWEAPASGQVYIETIASLVQNSTDGVDLWMELGGMNKSTEEVSGFVPPQGTLISSPITFTTQNQQQNLSGTAFVQKGQRIYIIASSKNDPTLDRLLSETSVQYVLVSGVATTSLNVQDANNNYYFKQNSKTHYLASSRKDNIIGDKSKVNIGWNLGNEIFTDDVDFKIYKTVRSVTDTSSTASSGNLIYHHKLIKGSSLNTVSPTANLIPGSNITNLLLNQSLSDPTMTLLHFEVSSDTNVKWEKIVWRPEMLIESVTDTTQIKALVEYLPFSEKLTNTLPQNFDKYRRFNFCDKTQECPRCKSAAAYYLFPNYNGNANSATNYTFNNISGIHNTKVTFSLKIKDNNGNIYTAKNTVDVINNVMPIPKIDICEFFSAIPLSYYEICSLPFYFEISSLDYMVTKHLALTNAFIINSAFLGDPTLENTGHLPDYNGYRSDNTHYNLKTGLVYKGWGGFTYNGSKYPNSYLKESEFNVNTMANLPQPGGPSPCDPASSNYVTCMINLINQQNSNRYFTPLELDADKYAYISPLESVEMSGSEMKPILLGVSATTDSIVVTPIYAVPNPMGLILRTQTEGYHAYAKGSFLPWLGISGHGGYSVDKTSDYFLDFNGDRYPDVISGSLTQKTNQLGQLGSSQFIYNITTKNKGTVIAGGVSAAASISKFSNTSNISFAFAGEKDTQVGSSSFSLGIGANIAIGKAWSEGTGVWVDINGDGLIDYITQGGSQLNNGYGLINDVNDWDVADVSKSTSLSVSGGGGFATTNNSLAGGVGLSKSKSTATVALIDINGDGLADKIIKSGNSYMILINNGTSFINQANFNKNFSLDTKQNSSGLNIFGTICVQCGGKLCISVGGATDKSVSKQEADLRDFDGDGYPDLLLSTSDSELIFYQNKLGRSNMLISIENPLQGIIKMEYDNVNVKNNFATLIGGTYQMPFSKTVLSDVQLWNFRTMDTLDPAHDISGAPRRVKPYQNFHFEYEKGIQDRREREFLGFGVVTTKVFNGQNIHQTFVTEYETNYGGNDGNFFVNFDDTRVRQYFYKKGLVRSTFLLDNQNRKRTETSNIYKYFSQSSTNGYILDDTVIEPQFKDISRIIPLLYKTESTTTEYSGSNNHSKTTVQVFDQYDRYGNISKTKDFGVNLTDTNDDVRTAITYHPPGVKNVINTPSEIEVSALGAVQRKTSTLLDAAQNIKKITKNVYANPSAQLQLQEYDFEYDTYGNLKKLTNPNAGSYSNNQRLQYNYVYDPIYNTYLTSTTDSYQFTSSIEYDSNYLYGVPKKIFDKNGGISQFSYDSFGRTTQFTAANDTDWTLKFYYYPSQTIPVAITERRNPVSGQENYFGSIFTDAWGEAIMSKSLFKKQSQSYYFTNNVFQLKDELARPVKTIFRDFVTTGNNIIASLQIYDDYTTSEIEATQTFNTITYDELDRPLTSTQHNVETETGVQNLVTSQSYEFGPDRDGITQFVTKTQNPIGNKVLTYSDAKDQVTASKQLTGSTELWSSYQYDPLGQVISSKDAGNNITLMFYDTLGRMYRKIEPDAGTSNYFYTLDNKLEAYMNPLIDAVGTATKYVYNYEQLTKIVYYDHEVNLRYGPQSGPAEERGRVIKQTDRTGTQVLKYDLFGNIKENIRVVVAPENAPKLFKTLFKYDVYGRIQKITYPDLEEVDYTYNFAGLLNKITSIEAGQPTSRTIVDNLSYDNRNQLLSYNNGNNTIANSTFSTWGRLEQLKLSLNPNSDILTNYYKYNGSGNLSKVTGTVPMNGSLPVNDLAIPAVKTYQYDNFERLSSSRIYATGKFNKKFYQLHMNYNPAGNIANKIFQLKTYDNGVQCQYPMNEGDEAEYKYLNPTHPNAVSSIEYKRYDNFNSSLDCGNAPVNPQILVDEQFSYDVNGNMTAVVEHNNLNTATTGLRTLHWDVQNRLQAVAINRENFNYYVYDGSGARILKSDAVSKKMYVNGNDPKRITQIGAFIYYPSGFFVLSDKTMNKHYFMGGQRIATKVSQIPSHRFKTNPTPELTALSAVLSQEIRDLLQIAGLPPAYYVQNPDSQSYSSNNPQNPLDDDTCKSLIEEQLAIFQDQGQEDCYKELITLYENCLNNDCAICDLWNEYSHNSECMTPPAENLKSEMYWIHPDQQSGSSVITNSNGAVTNWYEYMPYGEMLMESSTSIYNNVYKFNGREFDSSTGYYLYGARYYDPKRSTWLSVDPLAVITNSPYAYSWNDPVNYADPSGLMGERIGGPGNEKKSDPIYGGKGTLIQEVIIPWMPHSKTFTAGFKDGFKGAMFDMITFKGIRDAAKVSFETIRGIVSSGNLPLGSTLCFTGNCPSDPTENMPYEDKMVAEISNVYLYGNLYDKGRITGDLTFTAITILLPLKVGKFGRSLPKSVPNIAAKGVTAEGAVWAQKTYSGTFGAGGKFAEQTVEGVAGALRSGTLSAADVPINVILRNGQTFILNTRSSAALMRGGVPRSAWNIINQTGVSSFETMLTGQLERNGLINGTKTIRQSGTQLILSH
ncbi:hypothetical protein ASG01_13665 [Chryseobacterium sp. Leaf180]|uniref:RHS repeat-associated core domain-containing protein n=1 Tax=Chryseobacterium sp. Leaf180 TaxID=1736289 RepID=UPI0006FE758A|nr:RHS repeat-associated core domain-containing protein [Chryseobacterium sp. Leaf180]KQR91417.1 hypothetical protein ASG01_13665 [Chryseobacterium sp. Leaf180]